MNQWLSTCRSCGQTIAWDTTKNGKRVPIDPDGRIHFGTCPARLFAKGRGRVMKVQPKANED